MMRDLNASTCNGLYEKVEWSGTSIIGTLVILAFVDVMVILGNVLVILAVYHTTKLRNVTNMFIVSLAVADLLVGVAVLPFSATLEVFEVCQKNKIKNKTHIKLKKKRFICSIFFKLLSQENK